jgi:protein O-mannosyl-transferase
LEQWRGWCHRYRQDHRRREDLVSGLLLKKNITPVRPALRRGFLRQNLARSMPPALRNRLLDSRGWPWLGILGVSGLAHLGCLGAQFFLDDGVAIEQNAILRSGRFWEAGLDGWTVLGYVVQQRLFGISACGFHAVNWLLHSACACMVYALGRRILTGEKSATVALLAALLFAAHPLASEIPNYARTQDLAWVTLFSLVASWAILRWLENGAIRHGILCVLALAGATFSKGPGLLHGLMMAGTLGFVFAQPRHGQWLRRRAGWLAIALLALGWIGFHQFGGVIQNGCKLWSEPRFIGHGLTVCRVFWEFAWRCLLPIRLSADHQIAETLMPSGVAWWRIPDRIALWAALGMLAITLVSGWLMWKKPSRPLGVCLFLFVGSISMRLLYLIPEFMPEYRIYPGLPWFCLGAAMVLYAAVKSWPPRSQRLAAVILLAPLILLSARRAWLWHDLKALTADVLQQYPAQARAIWELHDRDLAAGNWQAIIDRQRTQWPQVAANFHRENRRLTPARELPSGHFALAEVACAGRYARALAAIEGGPAGLHEIARLENYMRRLGLDPQAHALHWSYFHYDQARVYEQAGQLEIAVEILRALGSSPKITADLERIAHKRAATPNW